MIGPIFPQPVETRRLTLAALGADALRAWLLGDAERLEELTGARIDTDATTPDRFDEDLATIHEGLRHDPAGAGWLWLAVSRETGRPIGVIGVSPVEKHVLSLGYSVDPDRVGEGYATEAVQAIAAWAMARSDVRTLRATIPAWNLPSIRVAENVGMTRTGFAVDPEGGKVLVYERGQEAPAAG
ncbi:MAG: GNAT family N-acetyltransferase [Gemmatimonadota bacterium]|nr:GNAT family N-acetyltransferase [Gemmatimonadota bacterium]